MSSERTLSRTSMSAGADELLPVVAELHDVRRQKAQHAKTNAQALRRDIPQLLLFPRFPTNAIRRHPRYTGCGPARPPQKDRILTTKNAKRFLGDNDCIFNCAFPA